MTRTTRADRGRNMHRDGFCANAVTDIETLLTKVAELEQENARLREFASAFMEWVNRPRTAHPDERELCDELQPLIRLSRAALAPQRAPEAKTSGFDVCYVCNGTGARELDGEGFMILPCGQCDGTGKQTEAKP